MEDGGNWRRLIYYFPKSLYIVFVEISNIFSLKSRNNGKSPKKYLVIAISNDIN